MDCVIRPACARTGPMEGDWLSKWAFALSRLGRVLAFRVVAGGRPLPARTEPFPEVVTPRAAVGRMRSMDNRRTTSCANCERLQKQLAAQQAQIEALNATVGQLQATVTHLQAQLAAARKDSSTSSKP